jgi:hypothetical protein
MREILESGGYLNSGKLLLRFTFFSYGVQIALFSDNF